MKKRLFSVIIIAIFSLLGLTLFPTNAFADDNTQSNTEVQNICDRNDLPLDILRASGCNGNPNELPTIIQTIVNSIIVILGTVAVIYIIIGGINYMTSAGDSGKLEKAKKTILYACIGLAICTLAFIIVNWTINAIKGAATANSPEQYKDEASCELAGYDWFNNKCR